MSTGLYLDHRPAVLDTTRYRSFGRGQQVKKLNYLLTINGVDISGLPCIGSGYIATEFRIELSSAFSFLKPYGVTQNDTFGLAVRYPQINLTGLNVTRYKMWDVDNKVYYPLYSGQRITASFALELWTKPHHDRILIDSPVSLVLSLLRNPLECCDLERPILEGDEYCGIWDFQDPEQSGEYDMPLTFSLCLVNALPDTFYRVNELGEFRITEIPDSRVYA